MVIAITIRKYRDAYQVIAERDGMTELLFQDVTFFQYEYAAAMISNSFFDKFNCRRVLGKWILNI